MGLFLSGVCFVGFLVFGNRAFERLGTGLWRMLGAYLGGVVFALTARSVHGKVSAYFVGSAVAAPFALLMGIGTTRVGDSPLHIVAGSALFCLTMGGAVGIRAYTQKYDDSS